VASSFRNACGPAGGDPRASSPTCGFPKNAPRRLHLHRCDRLLWVVFVAILVQLAAMSADGSAQTRSSVGTAEPFAWHWTEIAPPSRKARSCGAHSWSNRRMSQATPCGVHPAFTENCSSGDCRGAIHGGQIFASARKPPSQTWRTFLTNHLMQTAAIDFFTVPTATFRVLFVFVVLSHERRRVVHFGVTEHPQRSGPCSRCGKAFPWDQAPRYLLLRSRCHLRKRLRRHDPRYGHGGSCLLRRDPPGKIPLRNGWWAPSDASAWTTLCVEPEIGCVGPCKAIFPTISGRVLI